MGRRRNNDSDQVHKEAKQVGTVTSVSQWATYGALAHWFDAVGGDISKLRRLRAVSSEQPNTSREKDQNPRPAEELKKLENEAGTEYLPIFVWAWPELQRQLAPLLMIRSQLDQLVAVEGPASTAGQLVRQAVNILAATVGSTVYTAYFLDLDRNRVSLFHHRGVYFPETLHGICERAHLPRLGLLGRLSNPATPAPEKQTPPEYEPNRAYSLETLNPQAKREQARFLGTFRERESIKTTWMVPIHWRECQINVFLNWREYEGGPAVKADHVVKDKLSVGLLGRGTTERCEPEFLTAAVQYLSGWLGARSLTLNEPLEKRALVEGNDPGKRQGVARGAIVELGELWLEKQMALLTEACKHNDLHTYQETLVFARARVLERAATLALGLSEKRVHSSHAHRIVERDGKPRIMLRMGMHSGHGLGPSMPMYSLEASKADQDGLVEDSVSAQAAKWGVPILLDNMTATGRLIMSERMDTRREQRTKGSKTKSVRTLADLSVMCRTENEEERGTASGPPSDSEEKPTLCEVAVPIVDPTSNQVTGVIDVETYRPKELQPSSVKILQVLTQLFAAMERFADRPKEHREMAAEHQSAFSDDRTFVKKLCDSGLSPLGTKELLELYSRHVNKILSADCTCMLVYSPTSRGLRPQAISLSDAFCKSYLQTEYAGLGLPGTEPPPAAKGAKEKTSSGLSDAIRTLTADSMSKHLLPFSYGPSWQVWSTGIPDTFVRISNATHQEILTQFTTNYFRHAHCRVFAGVLPAQPDGVLWLRWMGDPVWLQAHLKEPDEVIKQRIENYVQQRLELISPIVAAMYSLHLLCGTEPISQAAPAR